MRAKVAQSMLQIHIMVVQFDEYHGNFVKWIDCLNRRHLDLLS